MKALIAPLVHNFYLEPIDYLKNIQLKFDMVIRASHPVHLRFLPIKCKQPFKTNADTARSDVL